MKVDILVGLPAAGKSTWLRKQSPKPVIMSSDDWVEFYAEKEGISYDQAWQKYYKRAQRAAEKTFFDAMAESAPHIVIDRVNLTVRARNKIITPALSFGYEVNAIVFPTPDPEEHQRRLSNRPGKNIPEKIIEQMAGHFVLPTINEGLTNIIYADNES